MNAESTHITAEQAREQLRASEATSLTSEKDRRAHAVGTSVLGLTVGLYMAAQNQVSGTGHVVLSCVFVAVCAAEAVWVERAARTVPRRAALWSRLGFGASLALALTVALPWLNVQAQEAPNTWPMVLGAAVLVAAPGLVAAAVIARGRG